MRWTLLFLFLSAGFCASCDTPSTGPSATLSTKMGPAAVAKPPASEAVRPSTDPHPWRPSDTRGWEVESALTHDLDGNGHLDYALVLKAPEPSADFDTPDRKLVVGLSDGTTTTLRLSSECIAMCQGCGGMMGDPYAGMAVRGKQSLSVTNYGGSSHRWSAVYTLAVLSDGVFRVAGYDSSSFHTGTPDDVDELSINLLSSKYRRGDGPLRRHNLAAPAADDCAAVDKLSAASLP